MIKFSYIVPTLLKFDKFIDQIVDIGNIPCIDDIIIINNSNCITLPKINTKANIIEINPKEPTFCNGAWNIGVERSNSEYIILATDDIIYDANVLNMISIELEKISFLGVLGLDWNIMSDNCPKLENIQLQIAGYQREYGFGLMMFMKRIDFTPIPFDIRHWYGDDYLYYTMLEKGLVNYMIKSETFRVNTEAGSMSGSEETKKRIAKDKEFWMTNYYSKFSKYGTRCG